METDWDKEEQESNAELYIKLYPYILRDFMHKNDLRNLLLANFARNTESVYVDFTAEFEGIRQGLEYKNILDSGDDISLKVKPLIEL